MKYRPLHTFLVAIAGCIMLFMSCTKDSSNKLPTCVIKAPADGYILNAGESVTIRVEASDVDGWIARVVFLIDSLQRDQDTIYPYELELYSMAENPGVHTLQAVSVDNEGGQQSAEITFTINQGSNTGLITDPRDGKTYKTVAIGKQTWFAENLNYEATNSWWYNDDPQKGAIYGRLYKWPQYVHDLCPPAWRVPTDDDWKQLEIELGMTQGEADNMNWRGYLDKVASKLKSTSGWYNGGNGINSEGFNALPGGRRTRGDSYESLEQFAYFWTRSSFSSIQAYGRGLKYSENKAVYRSYFGYDYGFSIRCIRDE